VVRVPAWGTVGGDDFSDLNRRVFYFNPGFNRGICPVISSQERG